MDNIMDMKECLEQLENPTDRYKQVDAVVYFILQEHIAYYNALHFLPERVKVCVLKLVEDGDFDAGAGYHHRVLREALRTYSSGGTIGNFDPIYTNEQLYGI